MVQTRYICNMEFKMIAKKTSTLNLRIDPSLKEALREAALRDHRSIANMVEMLIRNYCETNNIAIPEQEELFDDENN
jgi:hypothetical protein